MNMSRGVTYGNFRPDVHFQVLPGSQGPVCSTQSGIAMITAIADFLIWYTLFCP